VAVFTGGDNFTFMRHTFLVVTVKKWLKSVCSYESYREIKIEVSLFGPLCMSVESVCNLYAASFIDV